MIGRLVDLMIGRLVDLTDMQSRCRKWCDLEMKQFADIFACTRIQNSKFKISMDFTFTEEQLLIKQAAKDYAERELIKDVLERDAKAEIPWRHIKNLAELGFFGVMVDPKYGGGGMDTLSYILAIEEISKVDAAMGVILSVHNSLPTFGIERYGTEEQKEKYLPDLTSGRKIGAFLLSEPEAGSDATSQKTTAEDKGD
jgi:alkylation response protein AidB-like acyl-CoA dehydrogenase